MMTGLPPFYNREQNTQKVFNSIREKEIVFPTKVNISADGKDFILKVVFQIFKSFNNKNSC